MGDDLRETEYLVRPIIRELDRWKHGTQIEGDYIDSKGEVVSDPYTACDRLKEALEAIVSGEGRHGSDWMAATARTALDRMALKKHRVGCTGGCDAQD